MEPLSHRWYLRVERGGGGPLSSPTWVSGILRGGEEAMKGVVDRGSLWNGLHCSVCWQSPLLTKVKEHGAGNCPILQTFNKVWKNHNYVPITPSRLGLSAALKKEPVKVEVVVETVEKLQREIKGMAAAFEKRLTLVEKHSGLKRKADGAESSAPPEKRKKKARKGKAKGKQVRQEGEQLGEGAQSGKRKGKKKSNGPPPPSSSRSNVSSGISAWDED